MFLQNEFGNSIRSFVTRILPRFKCPENGRFWDVKKVAVSASRPLTFNSSNFGVIDSIRGNPRIIQLALRYNF